MLSRYKNAIAAHREMAVVILKPGYSLSVENLLPKLFKENGCELVQVKTIGLTPQIIHKLFHKQDSSYIKYLLSGPVKIFLLSGHMAIRRVYELKHKIRREFHRDTQSYDNIVHAADEGVEISLALDIFFPEYAIPRNRGFVDQLWECHNCDESFNSLSAFLSGNIPLQIIPCVRERSYSLNTAKWGNLFLMLKIPYFAVKEQNMREINGKQFEVYAYYPTISSQNKNRYKTRGKLCLGYTGETDCDYPKIMKSLNKEYGFCLSYHPEYSVAKVEQVQDAASRAGLICVAGSGNNPAFTIANDSYNAIEFERRIWRRYY